MTAFSHNFGSILQLASALLCFTLWGCGSSNGAGPSDLIALRQTFSKPGQQNEQNNPRGEVSQPDDERECPTIEVAGSNLNTKRSASCASAAPVRPISPPLPGTGAKTSAVNAEKTAGNSDDDGENEKTSSTGTTTWPTKSISELGTTTPKSTTSKSTTTSSKTTTDCLRDESRILNGELEVSVNCIPQTQTTESPSWESQK